MSPKVTVKGRATTKTNEINLGLTPQATFRRCFAANDNTNYG
jgi:hypothetical protein